MRTRWYRAFTVPAGCSWSAGRSGMGCGASRESAGVTAPGCRVRVEAAALQTRWGQHDANSCRMDNVPSPSLMKSEPQFSAPIVLR
ncbi:hypothetical protein B0H17DRAFT_576622 [Mycena rosella]|uniref:Uncharacterized protein n=1 Tax=Mycena rosella TaxID=1033263 RepID=A0AAD7GEQ2_MYCRO|nr:hypothetical protein B0H17DRAFT_576622 [Mycena rosella]